MARDHGPKDLASLLKPISGPSPTGNDVRYAGDHDNIREARRADDPALPQGVWRREPKRADWAAVEALASETLTLRSKDLQVAAWLAEFWVERRGFAGLAPGLVLLRELCARYWNDLHSALEPDDASARTAPFRWLSERLAVVVRELPVTSGPDERPYSAADRDRAQRLDTIRTRDPKAIERAEAAGAVTLANFESQLASTPDATLREVHSAVEAGMSELATLESVLDRNLGGDAPGFGALRQALEDVAGLISTALRDRPGRLIGAARRLVGAASTKTPPARATAPVDDAAAYSMPFIASREQAFQRIAEVVEFLAMNEPHSLVVPLLERALEWGAMPLDQLLQTLTVGHRSPSALFELLGLDGDEPPKPREAPAGEFALNYQLTGDTT